MAASEDRPKHKTSAGRLAKRENEQPTPHVPRHVAIFEVVKTNRAGRVDSLLTNDESLLNVSDHNNSTPLTCAFAYGHLDLALSLIQRGANPFAMNHSDKWGMRYIVEKDGVNDEQRQTFVEAVCHAREDLPEIFSAVWHRDTKRSASICAADPNQAAVRLADENGPDGFYNSLPYCGLTPLHYAVMAGDEATVIALLDAGAEVDAIPHAQPPGSRHTPMYYVPETCDSIAELLIKYGANAKHTTLYLTEGSKSMRSVVVRHGAGETPLLRALITRDFDRAAEIICHDASVIEDRLPGARCDTPLHLAVRAGSTQIVTLLLEAGMDVDTPSRDGYTALAMAPEFYCSFEMFQLLIDRGADVRAGEDSAIYAAAWQHAYGHEDYESTIRLLAEHGAKPRGLIDTVRAGNVDAAKLLIELGADVNETDEVSFYGKRTDKAGHTAFDYCTGVVGGQHHAELAALLRSHGAKSSRTGNSSG